MTTEPTFTLAEAARELARRECSMHGHDWSVLETLGRGPYAITCAQCGESWLVGPPAAPGEAGDRRAALLDKLRGLEHEDPESGHVEADRALLAFIDDDEIAAAFDAISEWYAAVVHQALQGHDRDR